MDKKELIVVGGPNGAGKSTFVVQYLLESQGVNLCADLIAKEFPELDPISQQLAAGREFLIRLEHHLSLGTQLIVETTLSGKTFLRHLAGAKASGYEIVLVFVFLSSAEACVARVRQRVRKGGHNVPDEDIRRRFSRSLANFWLSYRKFADKWYMHYNSDGNLNRVAIGDVDGMIVEDGVAFARFLELAEVQADD